jgi:hypothetical protein
MRKSCRKSVAEMAILVGTLGSMGAEIGPEPAVSRPGRARSAARRHCPASSRVSWRQATLSFLGRLTIFGTASWLASGGYGHTVCNAIGYGYVRRAAGATRGS